jgi:thiol-disulfide isomerase/thioredoxin
MPFATNAESCCLFCMRTLIFITLLLLSISGNIWSQNIKTTDIDGLEKLLSKNTDTVYVINFWATWCSPCVAEIGFFEELHKSSSDRKLQVILVNLDFPNQIDQRVKPFIIEKKLSAPVINMQDLDYNSWIPLVDSTWTGAIPATLIFKKEKRQFFASEITKEELFEAADEFF